jgi:antitoxin HigA-1
MKNEAKQLKHPGTVLSSRYFQPLGVSVTDFADALQVSRPHLSSVLNEKKGIGFDLAQRLELAGLGTATKWVVDQTMYDFQQWLGANGTPANVRRLKQ